MLPAASTRVSSPASVMRPSSHFRASSWGGLQHERVMPCPAGLRPNEDRVSMWLFKRGKEMPMVAMAAASIPHPLDTFSCGLVSSY